VQELILPTEQLYTAIRNTMTDGDGQLALD
jgi:hypothetical protein